MELSMSWICLVLPIFECFQFLLVSSNFPFFKHSIIYIILCIYCQRSDAHNKSNQFKFIHFYLHLNDELLNDMLISVSCFCHILFVRTSCERKQKLKWNGRIEKQSDFPWKIDCFRNINCKLKINDDFHFSYFCFVSFLLMLLLHVACYCFVFPDWTDGFG